MSDMKHVKRPGQMTALERYQEQQRLLELENREQWAKWQEIQRQNNEDLKALVREIEHEVMLAIDRLRDNNWPDIAGALPLLVEWKNITTKEVYDDSALVFKRRKWTRRVPIVGDTLVPYWHLNIDDRFQRDVLLCEDGTLRRAEYHKRAFKTVNYKVSAIDELSYLVDFGELRHAEPTDLSRVRDRLRTICPDAITSKKS